MRDFSGDEELVPARAGGAAVPRGADPGADRLVHVLFLCMHAMHAHDLQITSEPVALEQLCTAMFLLAETIQTSEPVALVLFMEWFSQYVCM